MDLADFFGLKHWSNGRIALLWTCSVGFILFMAICDARIREPMRYLDIVFMSVGAFALVLGIDSEAKGQFSTKSSGPITREAQPKKFRQASNMHIFVGFVIGGTGLLLQIWGMYIRFRNRGF